MARRPHVLQVRLFDEERDALRTRAGQGEVSDYVRTSAMDGIAPDVAADLRALVKLARQGGAVGEGAQQALLERVAQLCKVER
jgi:hypothetical protein